MHRIQGTTPRQRMQRMQLKGETLSMPIFLSAYIYISSILIFAQFYSWHIPLPSSRLFVLLFNCQNVFPPYNISTQASHDVKALLFWKGLIFCKLQFWVYQPEIRLHLFSLKSSHVASARGTSFFKKWPNINCSISLTCQPCGSDYGCLATGLIFTKHTMYRNLVSVLL